jgi:hypothetical protein
MMNGGCMAGLKARMGRGVNSRGRKATVNCAHEDFSPVKGVRDPLRAEDGVDVDRCEGLRHGNTPLLWKLRTPFAGLMPSLWAAYQGLPALASNAPPLTGLRGPRNRPLTP